MAAWQRCLGLDLEVPDSFGYYLAGFTDGEGSFAIRVHTDKKTRSVSCIFATQLRDDDAEILQEFREVLGVGKIYKLSRGEGHRDQVVWQVTQIGDIIHVIIPLFEKYPLRAKKKRDFAIWARAARIIHVKGHLTSGGHVEVLRLKREMEEGRRYNGYSGEAE